MSIFTFTITLPNGQERAGSVRLSTRCIWEAQTIIEALAVVGSVRGVTRNPIR